MRINNQKRSVLAFLACLSAAPALGDVEMEWQISANGYWSDNILLEDGGFGATSSLAFEVEPSIQVIQDSDRLKSRLNYSFSYITYAESLADQQALHNLDAATEIALVPDRVFLPASVNYSQALLQADGPGAYGGGLIGAGNLSDVLTYRAAPRLESSLPWGSYLLEVSSGEVKYADRSVEDAVDQGFRALVGIGDPEGSLAARIGYVAQKSEFENSGEYRFDSAFLEGGVRVLPDLRLVAQGGLETDVEAAPDKGGLDTSFWLAGIEWKVTKDDYLEVFVGRRFFGPTYSGRWKRTTRLLALEAAYSEDPTTQSRAFSQQPFEVTERPVAAAGVPGSQGFGRVTSDAFLSKQATASISVLGRLTTIIFSGRTEDRRYYRDDSRDQLRQLGVTVERRFSSEMRVSLGADVDRYTIREGQSYDELRLSLRASRAFGDSLSGEFEATRIDRDGELEGYDVNFIRVGVVKRFAAR